MNQFGYIPYDDTDADEDYTPPTKRQRSQKSVSGEVSPIPAEEYQSTILDISSCSQTATDEFSLMELSDSICSPKASRGRRRQRDPTNWACNIANRKRNTGKQYFSRHSNKVVRAREMKHGYGEGCRNQCKRKVTEDQRMTLFRKFWELGCLARQRDYLCAMVFENTKKLNTTSRKEYRRKRTLKWAFQVDDVRIEVCKKFFIDTLNISDKMVITALTKKTDLGTTSPEKRGTHKQNPNAKEDEKNYVRRHIESFPVTESHYCTKESRRRYLSGDLSVQKMFDSYLDDSKTEVRSPVSLSTYKQIFYAEYNFGFFKRSKDRCDFCTSFENMVDKEDKRPEYDKHHEMKNKVRGLKDADKVKAKNDPEFSSAVFDLEDVLLTPKGSSKGFYHKRRLNTYNLTI